MIRVSPIHKLAIAATAVLVVGAAPAAAQEKGGDARPSQAVASESLEAMQAIGLARDLVRHGVRDTSALALATAAQILIDAEGRPLQAELEQGRAGEGAVDKPSEAGVELSPGAILARALTMNPDAQTRALIQNLQRVVDAGPRGRVGGPAYGYFRVQANSTNTHTITFRGGEYAEIWVEGDGDTDLDCFVYDESGYFIASDTDYTDTCLLTFNPRWTGPFQIEIVNLGRVWNEYLLETN